MPLESPTITIGSLSKLFWPGLRIGWMRAEASVIADLARIKALMDLGSSLPSQLLAQHLLGSWGDVRSLRQAQVAERHALTSQLLADRLPCWRLHPWSGGLFVWVETDRDGDRLAQLARRNGVVVLPGSLLSASGGHTRFLRLSLAPALPTLQEGLHRLIDVATRPHALDESELSASAPTI